MQILQTQFHLGGETVTSRQQAIAVLDHAKQDQSVLIEQCCAVILWFAANQSSDLGRSPASSLLVVGQGGKSHNAECRIDQGGNHG